jgi:16S rRNA (cytidine1402-2'-O)-methyltransferase
VSQKYIYLIPCHLSETPKSDVLSHFNIEILKNVTYFFVENVRTARRFISSLKLGLSIDSLIFFELNKDTSSIEIKSLLNQVPKNIENIGVLSEAGCPGIADPGAKLVAIAHQLNYKIIPIPGPSSLFLGLMGSGFNGQQFYFHGYLPIKQDERVKAIRKLEDEANLKNITQIFIETPFRNLSIFQELINTLKPSTLLCIASNLTSTDEFLVTKKASDWKNNIPSINKIPTIFLIGRNESE